MNKQNQYEFYSFTLLINIYEKCRTHICRTRVIFTNEEKVKTKPASQGGVQYKDNI